MKAHIFIEPGTVQTSIMITEQRGDVLFIAKPIQLEFEPHEPGFKQTPPTLSIPLVHSNVFLESLAKALDELKIKPESIHKLEGVLEARKEHLEREKQMVDNLMRGFVLPKPTLEEHTVGELKTRREYDGT